MTDEGKGRKTSKLSIEVHLRTNNAAKQLAALLKIFNSIADCFETGFFLMYIVDGIDRDATSAAIVKGLYRNPERTSFHVNAELRKMSIALQGTHPDYTTQGRAMEVGLVYLLRKLSHLEGVAEILRGLERPAGADSSSVDPEEKE